MSLKSTCGPCLKKGDTVKCTAKGVHSQGPFCRQLSPAVTKTIAPSPCFTPCRTIPVAVLHARRLTCLHAAVMPASQLGAVSLAPDLPAVQPATRPPSANGRLCTGWTWRRWRCGMRAQFPGQRPCRVRLGVCMRVHTRMCVLGVPMREQLGAHVCAHVHVRMCKCACVCVCVRIPMIELMGVVWEMGATSLGSSCG